MNAQNFYEQGVTALRERQDIAEARRLLTRAVKTDPQNDMAWLWLSRTLDDPKQQLQAVERALKINPNNTKAHTIRQKLLLQVNGNGHHANGADKPSPNRNSPQVTVLLRQAEALSAKGDDEGAIAKWVDVLEIQVDHEIALREAVKALVKLKYRDDAKELIWKAIEAKTTNLSVYLTALDFAGQDGDHQTVDSLRVKILKLPTVTEDVVMKIAKKHLEFDMTGPAQNALEQGLAKFPDNQDMLLMMGDLQKHIGKHTQAVEYYDRAAALGLRSKAGKEADKRLQNFAPVMTDKERGSVLLAWRETGGILLVFFTMAWMDSGLDMLKIDVMHWLGVILSIVGGYLVITATSSPHQGPLVRLLGGEVDPDAKSELPIINETMRYAIGALGGALLLLALWLTFGNAIGLLLNPVEPSYPFDLSGF